MSIIQVLLALFAFAANSVLCRLALSDQSIDANSFTFIRILSGAIMLAVLIYWNNSIPKVKLQSISWVPSFSLLVYCVAFSFAYNQLDAGIGALVLFGTVQIVLLSVSLIHKEAFNWKTIVGFVLAITGFIVLMFPSTNQQVSSSPLGLLLMTISGVGWALYTLKGRLSTTPLLDTGLNFKRATLLYLGPASLYFLISESSHISALGLIYAITSGAITSGLGYAIWYKVLPLLSRIQAGVLQLCVPLIAALGGVVFINEVVSLQLVVASVMLLGGVLITLLNKPISH